MSRQLRKGKADRRLFFCQAVWVGQESLADNDAAQPNDTHQRLWFTTKWNYRHISMQMVRTGATHLPVLLHLPDIIDVTIILPAVRITTGPDRRCSPVHFNARYSHQNDSDTPPTLLHMIHLDPDMTHIKATLPGKETHHTWRGTIMWALKNFRAGKRMVADAEVQVPAAIGDRKSVV